MMQVEQGSILPKPSDELLSNKEKFYRVKFPNSYIDFIKKYNGAIPNKRVLSINEDDYLIERFLCFLGDKKKDFEAGWFDVGVITSTEIGERLSIDEDELGLKIIPILELVGKDYVCLDFRNDVLDPEICIWYNDESEDFLPSTRKIANSFSEFIDIFNSKEIELDWTNPNCETTYGNTFTAYGSKLKRWEPKNKVDGKQYVQWLDDEKAAAFIAKVAQEKGEGTHEVLLSSNIPHRVILTNGKEYTGTHARIIVNPDGSVKTAYPFNRLFLNR